MVLTTVPTTALTVYATEGVEDAADTNAGKSEKAEKQEVDSALITAAEEAKTAADDAAAALADDKSDEKIQDAKAAADAADAAAAAIEEALKAEGVVDTGDKAAGAALAAREAAAEARAAAKAAEPGADEPQEEEQVPDDTKEGAKSVDAALIDGANEAAAKLNDAVKSVDTEDEASMQAVADAYYEAEAAMTALQAALDNGAEDSDGKAAEALKTVDDAMISAMNTLYPATDMVNGEIEEGTYRIIVGGIVEGDVKASATYNGGAAQGFDTNGMLEDVNTTGGDVVVTITPLNGKKINRTDSDTKCVYTHKTNGETTIAGGSFGTSGDAVTVTLSTDTVKDGTEVLIQVVTYSAYTLATADATAAGITRLDPNDEYKDVASGDVDTTPVNMENDGEELAFRIKTPVAGKKYNVSYAVDGSNDKTPITPESIVRKDQTKPTDVYKISVPEGIGSIVVTVEEAGTADYADLLSAAAGEVLTIFKSFNKNLSATKNIIDITFEEVKAGKKTGKWVKVDDENALTGANVGDDFKFKAEVGKYKENGSAESGISAGDALPFEIKKITYKLDSTDENEQEKTIEADSEGVYTFKAFDTETNDNAVITIDVESTEEDKFYTLSFKLADGCDEDSVKKIKVGDINYADIGAKAFQELNGNDENYKTLLDMEYPETQSKTGKLKIPATYYDTTSTSDKAFASIVVTVTLKNANYNAEGSIAETMAAGDTDTTKTITLTKAQIEANDVDPYEITTTHKAIAADNYVKILLASDEEYLKDLEVVGDENISPAEDAQGTVKPDVYKIATGAKTVDFKVTADAGHELDFDVSTGLGAGYLRSQKVERNSDDSTTYSISIYANKLTAGGTLETPKTAVTLASKASTYTVKYSSVKSPAMDSLYTMGIADSNGNAIGTADKAEWYGTEETPVRADIALTNGTESAASIPYGATKFTTAFKAAPNCKINSVTYTMGGSAEQTVTPNVYGTYKIDIAKVTGNIEIKVDAGTEYKLADLKHTTWNQSDAGFVPNAEGAYEPTATQIAALFAAVEQGADRVPVANVKAVVTDENDSQVNVTRITDTTNDAIKLDLSKAKLEGQRITISMYVTENGQDVYVGKYSVDIPKKTTTLTIAGFTRAAVDQKVDTVVEYDLVADGGINNLATVDGELTVASVVTESSERGYFNKIEVAENGTKLRVTLEPKKASELANGTEPGSTRKKYDRTATITLEAKDDATKKATLKITLKPIVNPDDVTLDVTQAQPSDAFLNLNLSAATDGVPHVGKLYYDVAAKVNQTNIKIDSKIMETSKNVTNIEKTGDSQVYSLPVSKAGVQGSGMAAEYTVTATLKYYTGSSYEEIAKFTGKDADKKDILFSTVDNSSIYYENNLKLKKLSGFKGSLTQGTTKSIPVATLQWSDKKNPYKYADFEVADNRGDITAYVSNNDQLIVTNVPKNATVGKHVLTVTAVADEANQMHRATATLNVDVVKGVSPNGMEIVDYSRQLYKNGTKGKTTMKMSVKFHNGTPKNNKLVWTLVSANTTNGEKPITTLPSNFNGALQINAKNGTLMLDNAKYVLNSNKKNNQFKVLVRTDAAYGGDARYALSDTITITDRSIDVKTLKVVFVNDNAAGKKVVWVQDNDKAPVTVTNAGDLDGAEVFVVEASSNVKAGEYTATEWSHVMSDPAFKKIDATNYALVSGNAKMVEVKYNGDYWLDVHKAGKNVKLTITPRDGSKGKRTVQLAMDAQKITEGQTVALMIGAEGMAGDSDNNLFNPIPAGKDKTTAKTNGRAVNLTIKENAGVTGAAKLNYTVCLMDEKGNFAPNPYTNCKIKVKNGKMTNLEYKDADGDYHTGSYIITTNPVTQITLSVPGTKSEYVYTITNLAYGKGSKPSAKALNSLHEYGTTNAQKVTFEVKDGKSPVADGTKVKVEIDRSAVNSKNVLAYNYLASKIKKNELDAKDGKVTLELLADDGQNDGEISLTPGTYKMNVTLGKKGVIDFTPVSDAASVTVKVEKLKNFTFKPQVKYNFSVAEGAVVLTGKSNESAKAGEKRYVVFSNLRSDNIDGRANNFTKYFKLVSDPTNNTYSIVPNTESDALKGLVGVDLKKPDWSQANWGALVNLNKKDLTGYVSYRAGVSDSYYRDQVVEGTTKITLTIQKDTRKAAQKYTADEAGISYKANSETRVNIRANGEFVKVRWAVLGAPAKNEDADTAKLIVKTNTNKSGVNASGQVLVGTETKSGNLDTGKNGKGRTYKKTILVLPENSPYAALISDKTTKKDLENNEALVRAHGIPVEINVVAKPVEDKNVAKAGTPATDVAAAVSKLKNESLAGIYVEDTTISNTEHGLNLTAGTGTINANIASNLTADLGGGATVEITNALNVTVKADRDLDRTTTLRIHVTVNGREAYFNVTVPVKVVATYAS